MLVCLIRRKKTRSPSKGVPYLPFSQSKIASSFHNLLFATWNLQNPSNTDPPSLRLLAFSGGSRPSLVALDLEKVETNAANASTRPLTHAILQLNNRTASTRTSELSTLCRERPGQKAGAAGSRSGMQHVQRHIANNESIKDQPTWDCKANLGLLRVWKVKRTDPFELINLSTWLAM